MRIFEYEVDLNTIAAVVIVLLSIFFALEAWSLGTRNTQTCAARTTRGGRCRHRFRPGRPCPAGHTRDWVPMQYVGSAALIAIAVGVFITKPFPSTIEEFTQGQNAIALVGATEETAAS